MISVQRMALGDARHAPQINMLLGQLSGRARLCSEAELREGLSDKDTYLFKATDTTKHEDENIVGMSMIFFQWRAEGWYGGIQSVVRDKRYAGQKIGRQLTNAMVSAARLKAQELKRTIQVELTCRPSRTEANKMYEEFGFALVSRAVKNEKTGDEGTNLYRKTFGP